MHKQRHCNDWIKPAVASDILKAIPVFVEQDTKQIVAPIKKQRVHLKINLVQADPGIFQRVSQWKKKQWQQEQTNPSGDEEPKYRVNVRFNSPHQA